MLIKNRANVHAKAKVLSKLRPFVTIHYVHLMFQLILFSNYLQNDNCWLFASNIQNGASALFYACYNVPDQDPNNPKEYPLVEISIFFLY